MAGTNHGTKKAPTFSSFEEFWPYYVAEHSRPATRALHFAGTSAALACVAGGVLLRKRWLFAVAPIAGYGPAWVSHFFIEKNKPATFDYPLWSLQADFVMWWKTLRGEMRDEVDRVMAERAEAARTRENDAPARTPGEAMN